MFTKRQVVDRSVQYPGRYQLVNVSNGQTLGTFDLTEVPGTITAPGTIIGAAYLQPIEDYLGALLDEGSGTITTSGWQANSGDFQFKINISIAGMLSTDKVDVFINNDDLNVAMDSELSPNVDSFDGGLTFYCKTQPAAPITFEYRRLR